MNQRAWMDFTGRSGIYTMSITGWARAYLYISNERQRAMGYLSLYLSGRGLNWPIWEREIDSTPISQCIYDHGEAVCLGV